MTTAMPRSLDRAMDGPHSTSTAVRPHRAIGTRPRDLKAAAADVETEGAALAAFLGDGAPGQVTSVVAPGASG